MMLRAGRLSKLLHRRGLLNNRPRIVASIASLVEQGDPFVGIAVEFGGQDPAFEDRFLFGRPVAVDADIGFAA